MPQKNHKTKSGFTIIEVVLVLAIAGLIFLMVFLALPALQRSQRDTQRRDDLAGFSTQITNYQSNNRGRLPVDWNSFLTNYMKQGGTFTTADAPAEGTGEFMDPDGTNYGVAACGFNKEVTVNNKKFGKCTSTQLTPTEFNHMIYVIYGAKCDGETPVEVTGTASRQLAFLYKLEGGGVYCNSNS